MQRQLNPCVRLGGFRARRGRSAGILGGVLLEQLPNPLSKLVSPGTRGISNIEAHWTEFGRRADRKAGYYFNPPADQPVRTP